VPDLGSNGQTGQDKSLELPGAQFRRRTCRLLTIRHVGADSERLWDHSCDNRKSRPFQRLSPEFEGSEKTATSSQKRFDPQSLDSPHGGTANPTGHAWFILSERDPGATQGGRSEA
jgi:hypothetical protein